MQCSEMQAPSPNVPLPLPNTSRANAALGDGEGVDLTCDDFQTCIHAWVLRSSTEATSASTDDAVLWHERLMHCGQTRMSNLDKHVDGTPLNGKVELPHKCDACMENTSRRRHLAGHPRVSTGVGQLTHSDWAGPFAEDIYFKCRWACCFVDDYSRFKWIFFTVDRTWQTYQQCFSGWCSILGKHGHSVWELLTDQGPELVSHDAYDFMDEHGVDRSLSCRYRQSQDGVAESVWRVAFAGVRAALPNHVILVIIGMTIGAML